MTSTEVATTESAELEAREKQLAAEALGGIDDRDVILPLVKIVQANSKEAATGKCPAGHFLNTLTGRDYGDDLEIIVATTFKGRFYSPDDEEDTNVYVAGDVPVVPSNWPADLAGKRFDELPEAEETYRQRVDAGEIEWGRGPEIRTTHNYIGLAADDLGIPLRLSLQRTSVPAARVINSLIRFASTPWAQTIKLGLDQRFDKADRPYYVVTVSSGEQTSVEQRQAAVSLYESYREAEVKFVGDGPDEDAEAKRAARAQAQEAGGIDV